MDFSNLSQLKVADLKQQLRKRGLSIVGNKNDLIQRLTADLVKEASLTIQESNQNIVKDPAKVEIDEDAILGDDDDTPSILIGKHDSLIQNEDLLLSETTISPTTASNMIKSPKNDIIKTDKIVSSNSSNVRQESQTSSKIVPSLKQLIKNKHLLTSEERKRLRMIKFADPKLLNRAERFGIVNKEPPPSEEKKLLQRIQRFGEVVSSKAKTLDERERLERRKARFGNNNNITNITKNSLSEIILKRSKRFGVTQKTIPNNILKRKRFAA